MKKNMNQLFITLLALMLCTIAKAQSLQLTYKIGDAADVTTEQGEPGGLTSLLGGHEIAMTVTELAVDGTLNDEDVKELRLMAGGDASNNEGALESLNLSNATFSEEGKVLPKGIFANCLKLEKVTLNNISEISEQAFANSGLIEITIPQSVTKVGISAFTDCKNLQSLEFEDGTLDLIIGYEAFFECNNLTITNDGKMPNRIISIGQRAFQGCNITKLTLPKNDKLTGIKSELDFNGTPMADLGFIGYGAFFGNKNMTELTIPANISIINEVLFQDCNLQTINFEDASNITEIQKFAFTNNNNLTKLFADEKFTNLKTIGEGAFQNCLKLTDADMKNLLTNVTRIERVTFRNCREGLKNIDINSNIQFIGDGAFADNPFVTTVTVHSGTQIDARYYDGNNNIFYGIDPNNVQVVFADDAEENYKNYRKDITVDGATYKNAFMYLLTKTLDENATDYTVVAQRHADVKLKRTFKAGWNTLVLPFGAQADENKDVDCAEIYKKALNASDDEGFMIAAYRGLKKDEANPDNGTFYFLKYANYDTDPLDEFEPLLIKMTQQDIEASKGTYTFENVELNYDAEKEYTAEEVKARMGFKNDKRDEFFDGNYDHEANENFKKCTYDDFYFTGTLHIQESDKTNFITPGDYIIQSNTFVKCLENKKYALKGFRGYFKKKENSTLSAKGNIDIKALDEFGEVTAIDTIDGEPVQAKAACIYNLNGQLVATDATKLDRGIYIQNGKKFVVK